MSWKTSALLGFAVTLVITTLLFLTVTDVGVTWDEPIYIETGMRAARWLGLVLRGEVAQAFDPVTFGLSWGLNHEHPPLMRVVLGFGWAVTKDFLSPPLTHRVGALLFAGMGLGAIAALIARERGPRVALFAIAAILTMPRAFFHAHLAALDIPSAIMWTLTSLIFYRVMKTPPERRTIWTLVRRSLILGVLLGLALLTKINTVLLMPFWALWLAGHRRLWRNAVMWLLSLPVALMTLVGGWPWLWGDTFAGLYAWEEFFRIHYSIPQWFAGRLYIDNTPWWGPVTTLVITTPALLLFLALWGAWQRRRADETMASWLDLHFLGMVVVLGFFALPGTHWHDNERMLLPAAFHLAILSGEGFDALWRRISVLRNVILTRTSRNQRPDLTPSRQGATFFFASFFLGDSVSWHERFSYLIDKVPMTKRLVEIALALLLLLPGMFGIIRLHPFELAYYNVLVGGPRGAQRLGFETIYFASTYGYFLPELNRLPPNSKVWVMPNSYGVLYYYQQNGLLRPDLIMLRPPGWGSFFDDQGVLWAEGWIDQADVALIERRQTAFNDALPNHDRILWWAAHAPEIARLERAGVLLASLHTRP